MATISAGPRLGSWRWWLSRWRLALALDVSACCVFAMEAAWNHYALDCGWCGRRIGLREIDAFQHDAMFMGFLVPRRWVSRRWIAYRQAEGYFQ